MRTVGIRELKNKLSAYVRAVREGEEVLVTDRGRVVAELRLPGQPREDSPYPALLDHARAGKAQLGAANTSAVYPQLPALLATGRALSLLDEERGER
jgi:antitoxin (DNA-binding transcriptional repressor) of toxin-antitoxin stability system